MKEDNVRQNSLKAWLLAARPKTLTGAAVPVMIGLSLAFVDSRNFGDDVFSWLAAALCMLFAFIMQIDANFVNDFFDYARGNDDTATRLGPLRACTQGWVSIEAMKQAIASTTVVACLVGLPLVWYGGLEMIVVGLLCVPSFLPRTGRRAGAGILRHRARLLHLLHPTAYRHVAGFPGFRGLRTGHRRTAHRQQLSRPL